MTSPQSVFKIALAGNPNAGKTTLFNALTNAHQHVGNYPGVTVEKIEGTFQYGSTQINVTDLPGIYSLSANSPEEEVSKAFLFREKPDVVINIVDTTNLERNLYLTLQLLEIGIPMVVALNMCDKAEEQGIHVDETKLSAALGGVPIIKTIASKGHGKDALIEIAMKVAQDKTIHPFRMDYGAALEGCLDKLIELIRPRHPEITDHQRRWVAINLRQDSTNSQDELDDKELYSAARKQVWDYDLSAKNGADIESSLSEIRYRFILDTCAAAIHTTPPASTTWTTRLDGILTNRFWGFPIFLLMMYLVFSLTFTLGEPLMGWIETGFGWLNQWIANQWEPGSESLLKSLLLDGVLAGVGGVLVFLPNIVLLFLAISILEDSGYMARAACLLDSVMSKFGLHGKSFIPLLVGFGCTVPAIISTRIISSKADRFITILILPLFSCGARLPIYALIIPAFFPVAWRAPVLWIVYSTGILLAIIIAKILGATLFKGQRKPFIIELPSWQMPTLRGLLMTIWHRSWLYLKKAGTIILMVSILFWGLTQWPISEVPKDAPPSEKIEHTAISAIGKTIEPILAPCGFDWKISTAMLAGLAAKEMVVSQLGIIYAVNDTEEGNTDTLRQTLCANYTPLQGLCLMLFCLITCPCLATLAVVKQECGGWRWVFGQMFGLTLLAWFISGLVYQLGSRLNL